MKRFAGLMAALAVAVLMAACGDGGEKGSETIPIAVVGPVTGQYASFGAQMTNGGQMAVDDINAAGGVLGKKLDLDIGEDRKSTRLNSSHDMVSRMPSSA